MVDLRRGTRPHSGMGAGTVIGKRSVATEEMFMRYHGQWTEEAVSYLRKITIQTIKRRLIIMNPVQEMKDHLYAELGLILRTTSELLRKIKPEQWDYKPVPSMRSLKELACHLTLSPAVDLLILQENPESVIRELEAKYIVTSDVEMLISVMEQGIQSLKEYMDGLTD